MKLSDIWGGSVSFKGVVLIALISLVVGLGISGSLDWLAPSRAVNFMGDAGTPDVAHIRRFAGFRESGEKSKAACRQYIDHASERRARCAARVRQPVRRR